MANHESELRITASEEFGPWVSPDELEGLLPEVEEEILGLAREINGENLVPRRTIERLRNGDNTRTNEKPERVVNNGSQLNRTASSGESEPNPPWSQQVTKTGIQKGPGRYSNDKGNH